MHDDDEAAEPAPPAASRSARSPHFWTTSTYFAEGFPYSVVNSLADVFFVEHKATLQTIGLTSLFHLPWNLKFLWAPFLDEYATKRRWLVWTEIALTAAILALAFVSSLPGILFAASLCFVVIAFLSATHDVAIDGFYLEALDKAGQAKFVGYRATAYRVAMLVVGGPILGLVPRIGWANAFLLCGVVMGGLLAFHAAVLPRTEVQRSPIRALFRRCADFRFLAGGVVLAALIAGARAAWLADGTQARLAAAIAAAPLLDKISVADVIALALLAAVAAMFVALTPLKRMLAARDSFYARAFTDFLSQKHVGRLLVFILLFRVGESFLMKMKFPFLKSVGVTLPQYAFANGTLGMVAGLIAPTIGGWLIARHGLKRWIWPFMLAQNGLHLLFVALAVFHTELSALGPDAHLTVVTTVIVIESFGAGLGTAAFMVYIMRCCRPAFRAAHMALLTALMSVSFTVAGVVSGILAEWLGFPLYFAFTFFVTVPGMLLTLFVPYLDGTTAADTTSDG